MSRFAALVLPALLVPALALAGCGDDEPGTDAEFVAQLCEAKRDLDASLATAIQDASSQTDAAAALDELVEPLEDFVEAFKDSSPPGDLAEWHGEAGDEMETAVERFKDEKTLASLEGFGDSPVPDPPAEAKLRLRSAAEDIEACEGVAFLKP